MANLSSKIQGVSQAAMPVVTAPTTVTVTGSWTSNATYTAKETRIGQLARYEVKIDLSGAPTSASLTITLPSGRTIDPDALLTQYTSGQLGQGIVRDTGSAAYPVTIGYSSATAVAVFIQNTGSTYATNSNPVSATVPFTFGSGDEVYLTFEVPIAGWESGTLQTASTHQTEYAASGSTWDAAATAADTVYGTGGATISGALSATRDKVVRFRSPVLPTDLILLEYQDTTGNWKLAADSTVPPVNLPAVSFGGVVRSVSGTDVTVRFNRYAIAGTTYNSATGALDYTNSSLPGPKWRLRKIAGGINGFGNATTTTPGLVTLNQLTPVTDWVSYTPTTAGLGTLSLSTFAWKRDGTDMLIKGALVAGTPTATNASVSLPTGHTAIVDGAHHFQYQIGQAIRNAAVAANDHVLYVNSSSPTLMLFGYTQNAGAAPFAALDGDEVCATGNGVFLTARIPIREWAGSLPGLVSDSQVEFAYNSDVTSTASVTATGFASGAAGGEFGAAWTTGTTFTRRVQFASAINATDKLELEFSTDSGVTWQEMGSNVNAVALTYQGTTVYGAAVSAVSSTTADVFFRAGGRVPNSATYGNAGAGWDGLTGGVYRWRVKKVKSSISALIDNATAASYGLVKGGKVPGATDGVVVAANYVGEKITFTNRAVTITVANTWYSNTSALGTLTAGIWLVYAHVQGPAVGATANAIYSAVSSNNTADSSSLLTTSGVVYPVGATVGNGFIVPMPVYYANVSTDTPLYAKGYSEDVASQLVTVSGFAVRIA